MQDKPTESPKKIFLITGINEPYLHKAEKFIESMESHSNVRNLVVTLDFSAPKDFCAKYPNIEFISISNNEVQAPNPNTCLQHGGFLPALKHLPNDAIIIFTDADISVQRGFTDDELRMLSTLAEQDIAVGYNAAPSQTLAQEMKNLKPLATSEEVNKKYPNAKQYSVFNTGVLVAQKKTYQQLYEHYIQNWEETDNAFGHYAKQQWLLSYLIQKHFNVKILADEIHTHDHHPIELRISREYGHKFCIENTPFVFSHHIPQFIHPSDWNKKIRHYKKAKLKWKRIACWTIAISLSMLIVNICLILHLR